jgi:hypothetical protein
MRARISVSVFSQATGTPSFQTTSVGSGERVEKLYVAGSVLAPVLAVGIQTFVSAVVGTLA